MQQIIRKNHMDIAWHEYTDENGADVPVTEASLTEKASIIGRVGIMLLSCGTGAWRVRSSMNTLAETMGITCTADIGLMSIEYTCFDGENGFTQSLCLTNTGVNTSKLNRLEHFIREFEIEGKDMSGEKLHSVFLPPSSCVPPRLWRRSQPQYNGFPRKASAFRSHIPDFPCHIYRR